MSLKKIEHEIQNPWRAHIREVLGQIEQAEGLILQLRGRISLVEQDIAFMRRHLGVLLVQIAQADELPKPEGKYSLSADGSKILGVFQDDEEDKPNGVAE